MGDLVPQNGGYAPGVNSVTYEEGGENNQVLAVQSGGCVICHSPWHSVKDCKQGSQPCFRCGSERHVSGNCSAGRTEQRSRNCYNCGKDGHISTDCTAPRDFSRMVCFACGDKGHVAFRCPNQNPDSRPGFRGQRNGYPIRYPPRGLADSPNRFADVR